MGQLIGDRLNIEAIKPRRINLLLIESGLQTATHKVNSKGKKHIVYELTEMGKKYGHYETTTAKSGNGKTVCQIRWFIETVDFLAYYV